MGQVLSLLVFINSIQDKSETPIGDVNIARLKAASIRSTALASEAAVATSEVSHLNLNWQKTSGKETFRVSFIGNIPYLPPGLRQWGRRMCSANIAILFCRRRQKFAPWRPISRRTTQLMKLLRSQVLISHCFQVIDSDINVILENESPLQHTPAHTMYWPPNRS